MLPHCARCRAPERRGGLRGNAVCCAARSMHKPQCLFLSLLFRPFQSHGGERQRTAATTPWAAAQGCGAEAEEADLTMSTPGAATARVPTSPTWIGCRHADPRVARGGRWVAAGTSPAFAPPRSAPSRGASSFSPSRGIPASSTGAVSLQSAAALAATTTQTAA